MCRPLLCLLALAGLLPAAASAQPAAAKASGKPPFAPAEIARAEALVKDVFKEEYKKAKSDRAARKALATTLVKQAKAIRDDAEVRYVALREARDLAAHAADTETAFSAITELALDRPTDVLALKAKALAEAHAFLLTQAAPGAREDEAALATVALALANTAADAEDFDGAVQLSGLAQEAARAGKALALLTHVGKRHEQLQVLQKETTRVRPAVQALKADPKDADASRDVGRYWCFFRGRWPRGLPYLATGSDAGLRTLAEKDLARPREARDQQALGNGWWDRAEQENGAARVQLLGRAYHWYQQAVFRLDGPARKQVETRLVTLRKDLPAELRVTDIALEIRRFDGHTGEVLGCALSPDGLFALSAGTDRTVGLWDTTTGKQLHQFAGHNGGVFGVAFSPDGKLAASCGEDRTVRLWDLKGRKELRKLEGHTDVVNNLAFSPDGRHLVSASDDRTLRLWDVASGKELKKFEGHTQGAYCVAFAPDGHRIASGGIDQVVRLWDATTARQIRKLEGHTGQVLALSFSPDGRRLLSSGEDQSIRLWDVDAGKEERRFLGHTASVGGVAFAPDGLRFLSASDDRTLRLWDVETGKQLRELKGHIDAVYRVVFSPDGRLALSCSLDKTLRLWGGPR
jgi:hypothetical protein